MLSRYAVELCYVRRELLTIVVEAPDMAAAVKESDRIRDSVAAVMARVRPSTAEDGIEVRGVIAME